MKIKMHQQSFAIGDFDGVLSYLQGLKYEADATLHVFSELFLTGYPLQDLCFDRNFIASYQHLQKKLNKWSENLPKGQHLLLGGLDYKFDGNFISSLENVVYYARQGEISPVYSKQLLPNYDIFEEKKYFSPGDSETVLNIESKRVGLLICEDMWSSHRYSKDPVAQLKGNNLDLVVNLSASPFHIGKLDKRIERAREISHHLSCPFVYVNRISSEDEIIFDGASFIQNADDTVLQLASFESETLLSDWVDKTNYDAQLEPSERNTWEGLFQGRIDENLRLVSLREEELDALEEAIKFGLKEYAAKNHFKKFTVALSGGLDSSLVLALAKLAFKDDSYLEAIYMPSVHSSSLSYDLSFELCQKLKIPFFTLPIKFLHSASKNQFQQVFGEPFEGVTDENIQSRLRGTLLYTRSNQINSMVINTSNKSEIAVGYTTQYGDSVGAISLLGDLYKSDVFQLARHLNKKYGEIIPTGIIDRPPSAELRPDQVDTESLPPYETLDSILEVALTRFHSIDDLKLKKFTTKEVEKVLNLYRKTEYKRYQFCPILKVFPKSFGFGYRIPISKQSDFYIKGETV